MTDLLVVGDGLFGRIITRHARHLGLETIMVGDSRPGSGSAAAGCVIKPSWVSSMSRGDLSDGLMMLDRYYGIQEVRFRIVPSGMHTTAFRVDPARILATAPRGDEILGRVSALVDRGNHIEAGIVNWDGRIAQISARHVVVAAGIWTPELCPWVEVTGRWGWSFRGPPVEEPSIRLWAPYRQVVALNLDDGHSWSGDGSALKHESLTTARMKKARERCAAAVEGAYPELLAVTTGARPYVRLEKGAPCLVSRHGNVIAVTGGAKNGTIAATWAARRVIEEIGE